MPTQQEIAADLGLTQGAVSNALNALGLLKREWEAMSLTEARQLLVRHYSEVAAGRGGSDQYQLTKERARESKLKGDLLELQIQEKAGTLIPAADVEREWQALIVATRSELLVLPDKIANAIKTLYGIDVDPSLIEGHVHEALQHLASDELSSEEET